MQVLGAMGEFSVAFYRAWVDLLNAASIEDVASRATWLAGRERAPLPARRSAPAPAKKQSAKAAKAATDDAGTARKPGGKAGPVQIDLGNGDVDDSDFDAYRASDDRNR